MPRLKLPRPLSVALQVVLSLAISLSIATIVIIVMFSRQTVPVTRYDSAPQRVAVGPDALALMRPLLPATDPALSAALSRSRSPATKAPRIPTIAW